VQKRELELQLELHFDASAAVRTSMPMMGKTKLQKKEQMM
jgi:hypothetical protein